MKKIILSGLLCIGYASILLLFLSFANNPNPYVIVGGQKYYKCEEILTMPKIDTLWYPGGFEIYYEYGTKKITYDHFYCK